jgi:hypothetical protein
VMDMGECVHMNTFLATRKGILEGCSTPISPRQQRR